MSRDVLIIQLGVGGIGRALTQQILSQQDTLTQRYGFKLGYHALLDSRGALHTGSRLDEETVASAVAAKKAGQSLASIAGGKKVDNWQTLLPSAPCIVVDVTAANGMEESLIAALRAGHRIVLANKRPLTGGLATFAALTTNAVTRYEATAGAGLPIISTLQSLLDSGDTVQRIEASMSGTLGYLCSALEQGIAFSTAVQTAKSQGWTEPDPRDDLSGADVARKALILARTCGLLWEIGNIPSTPLFPLELVGISVDEFLQRLPELDEEYRQRFKQAQAQQRVLRYVATIEPSGASVGLRELSADHPMASLRGPDNLFVFTTARYQQPPLVVRGPGAGVEVTAAGVLSDIVATARELAA